jgi:hypothetical protein
MSVIIYTLCMITALLCALLLLRSYYRNKYRLLLWSGLCFVGLSLNNLLLVIDRIVPSVDLSTIRLIPAIIGMGLLIFGLIWEDK